jgi:predicted transcriptional regulator
LDYDNLLIEETLDELIKGMEIDKSTFYKSYKALPLAIYIEIERLSVSKSALYKVYVPKHVSLPKAFIEASNKSNIVIFIALLFVI